MQIGYPLLMQLFVVLALSASLAASVSSSGDQETLEVFHRETGQRIPLSAFTGNILVLDFFAHWCVPCREASRQIEEQLRVHYSSIDQNRLRANVSVLAINVDSSNRRKTEAFMAEAGLETAYDDVDGSVFEALGGTALPFIVILDVGESSEGSPKVIYQHEGFEGVATLRAMIDPLVLKEGAQGPSPDVLEEPMTDLDKKFPWRPGNLDLEWSGEYLASDDVQIMDSLFGYYQKSADTTYRLFLGMKHFDLKYEPAILIPGLSERKDLVEDNGSIRVQAEHVLSPRWTTFQGGGYYNGFADYRSIWLDEHYRQNFASLSGYRVSSPMGYHLTGGLRWSNLPSTLFLQGNAMYQRDAISPGYEKPIFQPLVRGQDRLDTWTGNLSMENILHRRLRVRNEIRLVDTTERGLRYGYQGALNWAIGDSLVSRTTIGWTDEAPNFRSKEVSQVLEAELGNRWFLRIHGRIYQDSGLIRDHRILSSAQPPLETYQVGCGLRFRGNYWTWDLSGGPYWSEYGMLNQRSSEFRHLYADRKWMVYRAALRYDF